MRLLPNLLAAAAALLLNVMASAQTGTSAAAAGAATTPAAAASAAAGAASAADPHAEHRKAGKKPARPTLAVNAAFAPDGSLWVVGVDQGRQLWLRRSSDAGRSWNAPQMVDSADDRIVAEGDSRPSIAFGPRAQVVLAWAKPLAKPYTGDIRMVRSSDGGASFSAPFTVHADRQLITHRFQSIGFDAQGVLHTLWIDKRDGEAARAAAGGQRSAYVGAAIYRNESRDGGASFGPDLMVAEHSCECCRIALAPTPEGQLGALWRHVFAGERDHAFLRLGAGTASAAAPAEPVRASRDGWKLDVCPHHGPGLASAARGGFHAVWFGERDGAAGVRYGRLGADGQPVGAVQRLPDAAAEHADVMSAGQRVAIVWRSFDGQAFHLRAWVSNDDGEHFSLRELASTALDNDHPRLASGGGGADATGSARPLVVVWRTEDGLSAFDLGQ
jgi:hypothetical protein